MHFLHTSSQNRDAHLVLAERPARRWRRGAGRAVRRDREGVANAAHLPQDRRYYYIILLLFIIIIFIIIIIIIIIIILFARGSKRNLRRFRGISGKSRLWKQLCF